MLADRFTRSSSPGGVVMAIPNGRSLAKKEVVWLLIDWPKAEPELTDYCLLTLPSNNSAKEIGPSRQGALAHRTHLRRRRPPCHRNRTLRFLRQHKISTQPFRWK